jgi:hypothetical protein
MQLPPDELVEQEKSPVGAEPQLLIDGFAPVPTASQFVGEENRAAITCVVPVTTVPVIGPEVTLVKAPVAGLIAPTVPFTGPVSGPVKLPEKLPALTAPLTFKPVAVMTPAERAGPGPVTAGPVAMAEVPFQMNC